MVTSACPRILALNLMGTVMFCFFTVRVSNDDGVSLGMSMLHDASANAKLNIHANFVFPIFFIVYKS